MEAPSFTAKVWFNDGMQKFFATPTSGPGKDELYGQGDSEAEALDNLADGMVEKGYA